MRILLVTHIYALFIFSLSSSLSGSTFLMSHLTQKRDPDDDDGDDNEFYGENVGRQNVSKGNENCAGRS